jgi:hypothetical protein
MSKLSTCLCDYLKGILLSLLVLGDIILVILLVIALVSETIVNDNTLIIFITLVVIFYTLSFILMIYHLYTKAHMSNAA